VQDGEPVQQSLETPHPYGLSESRAPQLAWSDTLHRPGATYIQAHFSKFELAVDDYVIVRSPGGEQSWRYEGLGRANQGLDPDGFWSSQVRGDTAVIELFTRHARGAYGYSIDRFIRGFTEAEVVEANPGVPTAICGQDDSEWAKCYEQTEPLIYERARTVVRLHLPGTLCTGWLIGCEGHLMTNNHCIGSQGTANNTDYEFMAEGATCETSCFSSSACPGPIEATTAELIVTNGALDYTLVKLPTNVSGTYGFLRLRESGAQIDERIYIPQHPAGWGKRISVFSDHSSDASGFCEVFSLNSPACSGGPGDIGYFCDTQGGSSGSPVLAYSDHRVVSLHHCANCPNRGLDITDVIASIGDNLPACSIEQLDGTIELDRDVYSCDSVLSITVIDDSIQGAGSQAVTVASPSEPTPEAVTLTEQSLGVFVGSFATSGLPAATGDGLLSLAHGDIITAEYIDADDGSGGVNVPRHDTASADCAPPAVSDIQVSGITMTTAAIDWVTDEPATGFVQYGAVPPGSSTTADDDLDTTHGVQIQDLTDCTEYFFSVNSTDELGNFGTDDNGGLFYTFTTVCAPPPPIPNGSADTLPLAVERATADGGQVILYWDDQCGAAETNLLYGTLGQVSTYQIEGALCSISQPELWDAVPDGDFWFILVGENPDHLESSWGHASSGERSSFSASGQCGTTIKNPSVQCP
jgi:hypothetical protein